MSLQRAASEIWSDYLEGETDISLKPSLSNEILNSLSNQSFYCKYLLNGKLPKKKSSLTDEDVEEVSRTLYFMSQDPSISDYYVMQAMRHGADPTWKSSNNDCALHLLATNKASDAFVCALSDSNRCSTFLNNSNQTPLILACQGSYSSGQRKIVNCLLDRKDCKIDHIDSTGYSALYYAWKQQNYLIVKELLLHQASVLLQLSHYSSYIPDLYALETMLKDQKLHAIDISTLPSSYKHDPKVGKFFSPTEIASDLLDYTAIVTDLQLHYMVQRQGIESVLQGMLFYRVREELRAYKQGSSITMFLQKSASYQAKVNEEQEAKLDKQDTAMLDRYQLDLARRNEAHERHNLSKKQSITYRRQQEEYRQWDVQRKKMQDQIADQFVARIGGVQIAR